MPVYFLIIKIKLQMKKLFFIVALVATAYMQNSFAQTLEKQSLLNSYYDIKNALVNSDRAAANAKAADFLRAVNAVDMKNLPASEMNAFMSVQKKLASDAGNIAESKDIARQREYFTDLSSNLFKLAKTVKLTGQPVYYAYCPMKKSYWLSADAAIKNPYFGKQMLTCGKVTETLNR